jgi:mycoredoxin
LGVTMNVSSRSEQVNLRRLAKATAIAAVLFFGSLLLLDQYVAWKFDPVPRNSSGKVVIYTTEWCGSCAQLKSCLTNNQVPFVEKDIEKSPEAFAEHWALRARGVPTTLVGKEVVYGLGRERIQSLLAGIGHPVQCWATSRQGAT